jgi:hypothetical protein
MPVSELPFSPASSGSARVEIVSSDDARWPTVLELIDRLGQRHVLDLDEDGWLPARQSVLVAFVDDQPAGHLCFHLHPIDRHRVEARLDAIGFEPAISSQQLSKQLRAEALRHARTMNCTSFKGFEE